jgi:hypothetical protein
MSGMGGTAFGEACHQLPTASVSAVDLGRVEALPIAGLVCKPLPKGKARHHFPTAISA